MDSCGVFGDEHDELSVPKIDFCFGNKNLFLVQTNDEDQMMLMMMLINKMDGRLCVFHQMLLIAFHPMLSFYDLLSCIFDDVTLTIKSISTINKFISDLEEARAGNLRIWNKSR